MAAEKKNCWEFRKCGREVSGEHADGRGICPAAYETSLDGIHGGVCGGRACWAIDGTICSHYDIGTSDAKHKDCGNCDFYAYVRGQEGDNIIPTFILFEILEDEASHEQT